MKKFKVTLLILLIACISSLMCFFVGCSMGSNSNSNLTNEEVEGALPEGVDPYPDFYIPDPDKDYGDKEEDKNVDKEEDKDEDKDEDKEEFIDRGEEFPVLTYKIIPIKAVTKMRASNYYTSCLITVYVNVEWYKDGELYETQESLSLKEYLLEDENNPIPDELRYINKTFKECWYDYCSLSIFTFENYEISNYSFIQSMQDKLEEIRDSYFRYNSNKIYGYVDSETNLAMPISIYGDEYNGSGDPIYVSDLELNNLGSLDIDIDESFLKNAEINYIFNEDEPVSVDAYNTTSIAPFSCVDLNDKEQASKVIGTFKVTRGRDMNFTIDMIWDYFSKYAVDGVVTLNQLKYYKIIFLYDDVYYSAEIYINYNKNDYVDIEQTLYDTCGFDIGFYANTTQLDATIQGTDTKLRFTSNDVVSFTLNKFTSSEDENIKYSTITLKVNNNTNYDLYITGVIEPIELDIKIPDMNIMEIDDAMKNVTVQLTYPQSYTLNFEGEDVANNIETRVNGWGSFNLWYALKEQKASDTQITFDCSLLKSDLRCNVSFKLSPALAYATFSDSSKLQSVLYEYGSFTVPDGLQITEYYYDSYEDYEAYGTSISEYHKPRAQTVDLYDGLFDELTKGTLTVGTYTVSLAKEGMALPEKCDVYTLKVIEDTVSDFDVKFSDFFSGLIIGEEVDLTDCMLKVYYTHGNQTTIPMTVSMIGKYTESVGEQDVPITYKDITKDVTINVRKVKSFSIYEGVDKYYLVNDEPKFDDVYIKVKFDGEEDYDYVSIPAEKFKDFDTSTVGSQTFEMYYGGVKTVYSYTVVNGAYITYTIKDGEITLSKFGLGTPDSDTLAWVPQDIKNIVIPEIIDDMAVTGLGANLFKNQSILRTLVIPDSITTVGAGVVDGCTNLEKLTISGKLPLNNYFAKYKASTLSSSAVYPNMSKKLEVVISGSKLCDNFFADMYCYHSEVYLAKFTIGEKLVDFGNQTDTDIVKLFTDGGNDKVYAKDNVVYTDGGLTIACYSAFKTDEKFVIPEKVTTANILTNDYIKELTIPASVEKLGKDFVHLSKNLTTVVFESGSKVTEFPEDAFGGCNKLSQFNFPENLQVIGDFAMEYVAIVKLIIPKTVTAVGEDAFYGAQCEYLYIPSTATTSFNNGATIDLPNIQAVAYDGSVQFSKLNFYSSISANHKIDLYITGEVASIGQEWYFNNAPYCISKIYVCKGATDFDRRTYSKDKVVYETSDTFDKWWLS